MGPEVEGEEANRRGGERKRERPLPSCCPHFTLVEVSAASSLVTFLRVPLYSIMGKFPSTLTWKF